MKNEQDIQKAIDDLRDFNNTEVCRALFTVEGKAYILDRIKTLQWILED